MSDLALVNAVDAIVAEVSSATSIERDEILGKSRLRPIVKARHEVWRRVKAELGWSYAMIGKRFGVEHTTVTAAVLGRHARPNEKKTTPPPAAKQPGEH